MLFVILTTSGLLYIRTESFQEFIRKTISSQIESNTGLQCQIEGLQLNIYKGRLRLQGLQLTAPETGTGFSALRIEEIIARFSLSSLWRFRMRLAELHIERPQVDLTTGEEKKKEEDSSWNPEQLLRTLNISLRLETEEFTVTDGRITINEHPSSFNLALKDLDCRIGYQIDSPGYKIFLAYKESRLFYKQRDIVHDLKVEALLSLEGISIESMKFRLDESQLYGSGAMENWQDPVLQLDLAGTVMSKHLVLADDSLDEGEGMVDVHIAIRYDSDGMYLKGDFFARIGNYSKMDYSDLSGDLEILHDVLYLRNVKGRIAEGQFTAEGGIQLRESNNKPHEMLIHSKKVPLVEVADLLHSSKLRYGNVADAETHIIWGFGRKTDVDCDAYLYGTLTESGDGLRRIPLSGKVQFRYYGGGHIDLYSVKLESSHSDISMHGGENDLYQVRVSTSRLTEPFGLIANFSPAVSRFMERYPDLEAIEGDYEINGDTLIQSSSNVEFAGSITAKSGHWESVRADEASAEVSFKGSILTFAHLFLRRGEQSVRGELSLNFSNEENIGGLGFQGNFQKVEVALLKDFGFSPIDMTGALSGSGHIRLEKDAWFYDGQVSIEKGTIVGMPFDRVDARITFGDREVRFGNVRFMRGEAHLAADGRVDLNDRGLDFTAKLVQLPLSELPGMEDKGALLRGYASASGSIGGTWDRPALAATLELADLYYDSWNLGSGEGTLTLKENVLEGGMDIRPDYGDLSIKTRISMEQGYPGKVDLVLKKFNIQKMIAGKSIPYLDIDRTELNGSIEGEGYFSDLDSVQFNGKMDGALFGINEYELQNSGEIEFSVLNGTLSFETARITGTNTDLSLNGDLPLNTGDLNMSLNGDLNLAILSGIQEKLSASGSAVVDIRATGSKQNPEIIGRLSLVSGTLSHEDIPFLVSELQGDMLFSEDVVRLENIKGEAASGSFQLSGSYEHLKMAMESINMQIAIQGVKLQYPKDFNSEVNADLTLSGDSDRQILAGEVEVKNSEYIRDFNLLERFADQGGENSGLLALAPALQNLRMNVEFHSNNGLVIDNELARVRGSLRLTLRGTPAYPSLTGRVEAGEGTIFFRRNRFEITHAYADFVDRNRINPILEIRAEADVKTYRLILDVTGTLDNYSVIPRSDPPMSTVDIISLLTTGMAETGSQTTERETQMAGMSAASVLSENLTGVIGKRVERILGLESFRVDPFLAGTDNDPTARITVSERISRDIVLTFSRNLSTNEEQVVVIEYDVGKGLSITATRDEDGEFGVDFRLRKRFK